jgi:hypothetical protein
VETRVAQTPLLVFIPQVSSVPAQCSHPLILGFETEVANKPSDTTSCEKP